MTTKQKILIVDDDRNIAELISLYLVKECYETHIVGDGEAALKAFSTFRPDLILLDLMLPGMDGVEILKRMKASEEFRQIPVIMATAKGSEYDKIQSLDAGADDYLVKPFGILEMVSRVKAVLRRCQPQKKPESFTLDGLVLNPSEHTVTIHGERVILTYKEYELLRLFLSQPGIAFTREQLISTVWNSDYLGETRTVDMHIRTLRQKLGEYGHIIETVRNVGYRLEANHDK